MEPEGSTADEVVAGLKVPESQRRLLEELVEPLFVSLPIGIYVVQRQQLQLANPWLQKITGYGEEELLEMDYLALVDLEDREKVRDSTAIVMRGERPRPFEYRITTKAGKTRWVLQTLAYVRYQGRPAVLGSLLDVTERKRAEEAMRHIAYHDALTGLPNRLLFHNRLMLALAQAANRQQQLAVMWVDLDYFKKVNDSLGHSVGDRLLQSVGDRLSGLLRSTDTVARLGGDEFLLLLPGIRRPEDAQIVAEKLLKAFRNPFKLEGRQLRSIASIGMALYRDDGEDADTLMRNADIAMYAAKKQGRDACWRYEAGMSAEPANNAA